MVELKAKSPCDGLLPLTIGRIKLSEADLGVLTSVAPYAGKTKATSAAMTKAHGVAFPAANRALGKDGARAVWFGRDMALLAGPAPDAGLAKHAALTDQSDAWTCVELSGAGAEDVLARLVPVDLRAATFKRGHTVRSQIKHMNGLITLTGTNSFLLMVFRSMAATLVHDLQEAMASVASRG